MKTVDSLSSQALADLLWVLGTPGLRRSELTESKEVYDSGLGHIVAKPLWLAPVLEPQLVSVERVLS